MKCKYCNKEFETEKGLNIHIGQSHKEELKKEKKKQLEKKKEQLKKKKEEDKKKKKRMKENKNMPDHIEEYFKDKQGSGEAIKSRELFTADKQNIDLKTDLTDDEIALINTMMFNNKILNESGLDPVYNKFLIKFMRLKVSKNRESRKEFVGINQREKEEDGMEKINKNLENLTKNRK